MTASSRVGSFSCASARVTAFAEILSQARCGVGRERIGADRYLVGPYCKSEIWKPPRSFVLVSRARPVPECHGAHRGSDHWQTAWVSDVADQRPIEGLRRELRGEKG